MNEQDVERLAKVLAAHGMPEMARSPRLLTERFMPHYEDTARAVLASDWLAARVAAARADGRESLAGEIRALADEFADEKDHAARWARETNNSFHEAMSRKVAWESAETRLRALVAPTGHDGETGEAG